MSALMAHVDDESKRVSIAEFENVSRLFAVTGNETPRNGVPVGTIALMSHGDAYRTVKADRSLLPGASRKCRAGGRR